MTAAEKQVANMDKVEIHWLDSKSGPNEWEYREGLETLPPTSVHTIGYLLEEGSDRITVAQSLTRTQVHGRITIPSVCIVKLERL